MWGALSDEKTGRLQLLPALTTAVILGSESCGTHDHILLSQIRDSLAQPGGQGPLIYVPQEQSGPVIPQALGSLLVAFYVSQGCGRGIRARLHTGGCWSGYIALRARTE
jgi:hypothetical protein